MPLSSPCSVLNWAAWGPVITPAPTDEFVVRQADGVTRIETRAQVHNLEAGEHFIVPLVNEPATPTFAFGDADTGFFESPDDTLQLSLGGATRYNWTVTGFSPTGVVNPEFNLKRGTASDINPVFTFTSDLDSGIGTNADDQLSLIAGAKEMLRLVETGVAATDQIIIGPAGIIGNDAEPALAFSDGDSGLTELVDDNISTICAGTEALKVEDPADLAATETSLWVYDDDNGTIQQVTVGIADSGGAGFKLLRIVN